MKFTKEEAYKHLVSCLVTNKGQTLNISERSINEMLDTLIPLVATEETELADFVNKVLPTFKSADLNIKNDVTVGIKEYKDKNPIATPKPNPEPKPTPDDANAVLLARIEKLEKQNEAAEKANKILGIKANITAKIKEAGVKSDKWIETMIGNASIDIDTDVEAKAKEYVELYNSMFADVDPSITPRGAGGGKRDYIGDSIKEAAALAKSQNLIGG